MIIFGWGFQTIKNFGPVSKNRCSHCNNEDYWILTRVMTWFTVFFIPIFPYEIKYHLACPVCKYGITLKKDQISQMKPLAEINQLLVDGKITSNEYHNRMNLLNSSSQETLKTEVTETNILPEGGDTHLSYCSNCGTKATKELKFCGNCGKSITTK